MVRYEIVKYGPEPISLSDAKLFLKVDTTADDSLINNIITQVTLFAEAHTRRELRPNTWNAFSDVFRIDIKRNPVLSVSSVSYYRLQDGALTTVAASTYQLKREVLSTQIVLAYNALWPTDIANVVEPIIVTFVTRANQLTNIVKQDMLRHIAWEYENRGDDSNDYDRTRFYLASAIPNV